MNVKTALLLPVVVFSVAAYSFAAEQGHDHSQHAGSPMGQVASGAASELEIGNEICPVSGEKITAMGLGVRYEYKGKIYNFCCKSCVETFKNDPEKYVKLVKEQRGQHHVMGEMDEHVAVEPADEGIDQAKEKVSPSAHVKEFDLEAYQFSFSPDTIVVSKGDAVNIRLTSRDVPHGVFIKEYGINAKVDKGAVTDIEFVADKAGEFEIICPVYCGRGHHTMKAKLIVKEK